MNWSMSEIENMTPGEFDIYIALLNEKIKIKSEV